MQRAKSNRKQVPVAVPSVVLMSSVKARARIFHNKDRKKRHPMNATVQPTGTYEEFVDQNRPLHHPPAPFPSPPAPELEDGGGSTNTVLLNNPSSPVGSSGGKNLCLLSTSSSFPSPCREWAGADPARRNGFSFFGEGFVGVQSIASRSSTSFFSTGDGGF